MRLAEQPHRCRLVILKIFVASFVASFVDEVYNKVGWAARCIRVVRFLYAASTGEATRSPKRLSSIHTRVSYSHARGTGSAFSCFRLTGDMLR